MHARAHRGAGRSRGRPLRTLTRPAFVRSCSSGSSSKPCERLVPAAGHCERVARLAERVQLRARSRPRDARERAPRRGRRAPRRSGRPGSTRRRGCRRRSISAAPGGRSRSRARTRTRAGARRAPPRDGRRAVRAPPSRRARAEASSAAAAPGRRRSASSVGSSCTLELAGECVGRYRAAPRARRRRRRARQLATAAKASSIRSQPLLASARGALEDASRAGDASGGVRSPATSRSSSAAWRCRSAIVPLRRGSVPTLRRARAGSARSTGSSASSAACSTARRASPTAPSEPHARRPGRAARAPSP